VQEALSHDDRKLRQRIQNLARGNHSTKNTDIGSIFFFSIRARQMEKYER